jgi:hypothetical protein
MEEIHLARQFPAFEVSENGLQLLYHARHHGHEIFIPNLTVSLRFTCEPTSSNFMPILPHVTNRAVVIWLKYQLPFPPSTEPAKSFLRRIRSYNIYNISPVTLK